MYSTNPYPLYLVTDRTLPPDNQLLPAIELALAGGCTMVQLREKSLATKEFYTEALAVKKLCQSYHVPLIINDRVDVALAVDADGVHVGQSDLPAKVVRELIGPNKLLGVSCSNLLEAQRAMADDADYLGVGAMYATATKEDATLTSFAELRMICQSISLPVVAIGGINQERLVDFATIPLAGIAVVSAILSAPDTKQATTNLKNTFLQTH